MSGRDAASVEGLANQPVDTAQSPSAANLARLASATAELRARVSPRQVEIANNVFAATMRSLRRSHPVRAFPPHDYAFVGDRLIIDRLRREIDKRSEAYAVGRIQMETAGDHRLVQFIVELYVQYGTVIVEAADEVRVVAADAIAGLLGAPVEVEVLITHVHIGEVTIGNPHLVDPSDERL